MVPIASHACTKPRRKKRVSDYRCQIVKRYEAQTGDELACLHVMIDSNSHVEIANTYIPLDDIQSAMKEYENATPPLPQPKPISRDSRRNTYHGNRTTRQTWNPTRTIPDEHGQSAAQRRHLQGKCPH